MNLEEIPLFSMLRSRLSHLSERQRVISENVANADTPGYRPRDVVPFSFKATMQGQGPSMSMLQPQGGAGSLPPLPMPKFGSSSAKTTRTTNNEVTLDGNGVVLEDEMLKMSEARMDYDAAVGFYQKALGLLRMASRAPGR